MDEKKKKTSQYMRLAINRIYVIACACVYALILILYCAGIATYYSKSVDLISAIVMIGDIFQAISLYRDIFASFLGVTYVVLLILLIKRGIALLGLLKKHFSKEEDEKKIVENSIEIGQSVVSAFFYVLIFLVCCGAVREFSLNFGAGMIIFLGIFFYVARFAISYMFYGYNKKNFLLRIGQLCLYSVALLLLLIFLQAPVIDKFISQIGMFFSVVGTSFSSGIVIVCDLIKTTLYGVMICMSLKLVYTSNGCNEYPKVKDKTVRGFLTMTWICIALEVLASEIAGSDTTFTEYFSLLMSYLPLLLAEIVLELSLKFKVDDDPTAKPTPKDKEEKAVQAQEDTTVTAEEAPAQSAWTGDGTFIN